MRRIGFFSSLFILILLPKVAFSIPMNLSFGMGVATPAVADPVGYVNSVSIAGHFDDSFGAYASLWRMGFPAKYADIAVEYDAANALAAGAEYRLSVGDIVPYLRAGGGIVGASGNPSVSAPMVQFLLGARWLIGERWMMGMEFGRYAPMDEFGGIGGGGQLQLQFAYRFEL